MKTIVALILIMAQVEYWEPSSDKNTAVYIAPSAVIQRFHFGFNEQLADLFWIRALNEIDVCDKKAENGKCRSKSWLYRMLDLISELSPRFRMPMAVGPISLSVLVDDIDGASLLFVKASERFPDDFTMHMKAGYHFLWEVKDEERAAYYFHLAGKTGGPTWAYGLAARLYERNDIGEYVDQIAQELASDGTDEDKQLILKRINEKIRGK